MSDELVPEEVKQKLRRAASHLQGGSTAYFGQPSLLESIRLLYRMADQANPKHEGAA